MDNQRLLIWAVFGVLAWVTWQEWINYSADTQTPAIVPSTTENPQAAPNDVELPQLGDVPADNAIDAPDVMPAADGATTTASALTAPTIHVLTDVFELEISTEGGTLQSATLLNYPVAKDRPDDLVMLLNADTNQLGLVQTGLRSAGEGDEANHRATFTSSRQKFELGSADEIVVPLRWSDGAGVTVEKRYRFTRGSYTIIVEQEVRNNSEQPWRGAEYAQLQRRFFEQKRSMFDVDSYSFDGPIIYDRTEECSHEAVPEVPRDGGREARLH